MKLGRKLILGLIVLLILYASLFAGFSMQAQENIIVENIVTQTSNTLRQSVLLTDMKLNKLLSGISLLSTNQELYTLFTRHAADGFGDHSRESILRRLVYTYLTDQEYLIDLHILSKKIDFAYNGITNYAYESFFKEGRFATQSVGNHLRWYATEPIGEYVNKRFRPVSKVAQYREIPVFRLVKKLLVSTVMDNQIILLQDDVDIPFIVLDLDPCLFDDIFKNTLPTSDSSYMIVDAEGGIISSSQAGQLGGNVDDAEVLQLLSSDLSDEIHIERIRGKNCMVFQTALSISGWRCLVFVPMDQLHRQTASAQYSLLALAVGQTLLILALMALYVRKSVEPVENVAKLTEQLAHEYSHIPVKEQVGDEAKRITYSIGNLNSYIEELMKRNSEIARQEQEATILSLETQIVPHFLYNALNKLHLSALEANQGDLASRILRLASIFRYQIDSKMHVVFFYQDLQQLKQFVMAMQENKPQSFSVYYDIDLQLYDSIVPKMFLQPFVENSIVHGFRDQESGGLIQIRGVIEGEDAVYYVEDNGCGMDAQMLSSITDDKNRISGCGNVHRRITLLYGQRYGVSFFSEKGRTVATVRIPLVYEQDGRNE